ncbi:OmpA family protein [Solimonas marina]|uniref:OmpA family protein n=1 Tax=Solimonas marina TaxID=2714601 RepID=A0A969W9A1_9GAMM|nr:OmpA family protein [Solimonas marina]NKF23096.1 OmpA family protein [Solimonas marina]
MRFNGGLAGKGACVLAFGALLWAGTAAAVTSDDYDDIPYVGAGYLYEIPDPTRHSDDGQGAQVQFGLPLSQYGYPGWSAEATLHRLVRERDIDGKNDYQSGLMFDLVYDFGHQGFGMLGNYRFKPFVLGGLGVVQNDVQGHRNEHFGIDVGGGALLPLGPLSWHGLAARVEARALGQFDPDDTNRNFVIDYRFTVGLQMPLFFLHSSGHSAPPEPAQECPLAVVDPVTGRSDCKVDSDHDGVPDSADLCPDTPSGTPVDGTGCPVSQDGKSAGDEDGDGVPDATDKCPATYHDLAVDANGCMISQTLKVGTVQFDTDTAVLTDAARSVLDSLAQTLKNQENVDVLITGNTDTVGTANYNQALSLQRAESVRQHLIRRGIAAARMKAVGAGDTNPVAPNDTEAGRARNRRVDFTMTVK